MKDINLKPGLNDYFVEIDNHKIHFRCDFSPDSNEVILFIHGLACSHESFRNLFDKPYFPGKSLLISDLAGFGKSSKPESFSYYMEDQASILEKLLSLLPAWNIHIAAHSMGGAVALLFSADIMSRVKSFANIEGNLISDDCGIFSRGVANLSFEEYRDSAFKISQTEFKGHAQLRFEETTPLAVYKSAVSLVKWSDSGELIKRFNALTCRKCYIYGEENSNMAVFKYLTSIDKYMISRSGHGMMTDNPDEFYSVLAGFIIRF
jgi:pimeloyl-ACP methyl ester carboxylesterase